MMLNLVEYMGNEQIYPQILQINLTDNYLYPQNKLDIIEKLIETIIYKTNLITNNNILEFVNLFRKYINIKETNIISIKFW